jgi:hypothetical protein
MRIEWGGHSFDLVGPTTENLNAWQANQGLAVAVAEVAVGLGRGNWAHLLKKKRKRKPLVVHYSDFETREAYEQALAAALKPIPMSLIDETGNVEFVEDEDDELIKIALLTVLH